MTGSRLDGGREQGDRPFHLSHRHLPRVDEDEWRVRGRRFTCGEVHGRHR